MVRFDHMNVEVRILYVYAGHPLVWVHLRMTFGMSPSMPVTIYIIIDGLQEVLHTFKLMSRGWNVPDPLKVQVLDELNGLTMMDYLQYPAVCLDDLLPQG